MMCVLRILNVMGILGILDDSVIVCVRRASFDHYGRTRRSSSSYGLQVQDGTVEQASVM